MFHTLKLASFVLLLPIARVLMFRFFGILIGARNAGRFWHNADHSRHNDEHPRHTVEKL